MFIVTATGAGGERSGCLIGFATQCSVKPARFLACISKENRPVLADVVGWFAGRVLDRFDLGDHVGLWLEPVEAADTGITPDFGFQSAKNIDPGHPV